MNRSCGLRIALLCIAAAGAGCAIAPREDEAAPARSSMSAANCNASIGGYSPTNAGGLVPRVPALGGDLVLKAASTDANRPVSVLATKPVQLSFGSALGDPKASDGMLAAYFLKGGLANGRMNYSGRYEVTGNSGSMPALNARSLIQQLDAHGPTLAGSALQLSGSRKYVESWVPGASPLADTSSARLRWAPGPLRASLGWADTRIADGSASGGQCNLGTNVGLDLRKIPAPLASTGGLGASSLRLSGNRCSMSYYDASEARAQSGLDLVGAELVWNLAQSETALRGHMVRQEVHGARVGTTSDTAYRVGLRQSRNYADWHGSVDFAWVVTGDRPAAMSADRWSGRAQLSHPLVQGVSFSASWLRSMPGDLAGGAGSTPILAAPGEQWGGGLQFASAWLAPLIGGVLATANLSWNWLRPELPGAALQEPSGALNLGVSVPLR